MSFFIDNGSYLSFFDFLYYFLNFYLKITRNELIAYFKNTDK